MAKTFRELVAWKLALELKIKEHAARKALKVLIGLIRYLDSTPDP